MQTYKLGIKLCKSNLAMIFKTLINKIKINNKYLHNSKYNKT